MHTLVQRGTAWIFAALLSLLPFVAQGQGSQPPAFTDQKLDQILAPIALYPDALLAQILMATTYPTQVAEAAKWSKANPKQQGDDAVKAVQSQAWDPAVMSLVAFPQVAQMMGEKPDWVRDVGDAFLADSNRVMDRVQFLRHKAQESGNLKTTEQQKVTTEPAPAGSTSTTSTIVKIEPAQPEVVYVPTYNPTVVYGTWWYPAPPVYFPPPPGYVLGSAIAFGIGVGIVNSIWGGCNWGHGDVDINVNRYNNINVNKLDSSKRNTTWNHNPDNRRGVPYRDQGSQQRFGRNTPGADQRMDFRGRDNDRAQAQQTLQQRGIDPAQERKQLTGANRDQVQQQVNRADQTRRDTNRASPTDGARNRQQDHAFSGAGDASRAQRDHARGESSRQSMDRAGSRGAGGGGGSHSFGGGGHGGGAHGGGRMGGGGGRGGRR